MKSITIYDAEKSTERGAIINNLYTNFLTSDPYWHFFYEAEIGDFLRLSDDNVDSVCEALTEMGIRYEVTPWVETIEMVAKNLDYFTKLFHINSELVITSYNNGSHQVEENLWILIDRFSHQLHDNLMPFSDNDTMASEVSNLSNATVARARYDGYRMRFLDEIQSKR